MQYMHQFHGPFRDAVGSKKLLQGKKNCKWILEIAMKL